MITIYDCITDSEISARNKKELAKILSLDPSKVSRLATGFNLSIEGRYINKKEDCFIIEDIDSGKEYICATNTSFFRHLDVDYQENVGKYLYELLKGRQKTLSFLGRVYRVKFKPQQKERRRGPLPKGFNRITCPIKMNSIKITGRIRCRLYGALRNQLKKKNKRTFEYLGCTIEFFMGWIENQFTDGMSWERMGEIHIDHIKPCNTFDFNKEEEIYECFHYTNLRPLWAKDNLSRPRDGSDIKS